MQAVICFSHLRWNFVFQRPQHLMVRFAKTHRVFYIEEPTPLDDGAAPYLHKHVDAMSGVCVVTPRCPVGTVDETETMVRELLDTMVRDEHIVRPVLWYYTPMMRPLSAHLAARCVVYDCMDELANFKFAPTNLVAREQELLAHADVVFTGGQSLYEHKKRLMRISIVFRPASTWTTFERHAHWQHATSDIASSRSSDSVV